MARNDGTYKILVSVCRIIACTALLVCLYWADTEIEQLLWLVLMLLFCIMCRIEDVAAEITEIKGKKR